MRKLILYSKTVIFIMLLLMVIPAVGEIDVSDIRFGTVQPASSLASLLRSKFSEVNGMVLRYMADPSGKVYYVDGNKSSAGNGTSWSSAYNTLSAAMAKSHADIAVESRRAWATRNTIFVIGDAITEDLTKLAQKTDVIGLGSYNQYKQAGVMGAHVIEAATTAHYMGCRLINLHFRDDGAGGILFDIPINQNGIEFIGCDFQSNATDTIGLRLGGCHDTKITNCTFRTNTSGVGFSTAAIQILSGAGSLTNVNISGNQINAGAGVGIDWNETTSINCWITNNYIHSTAAMGIDTDDEAGVMVYDNRILTSGLAQADDTSNDFNILYAGNNIVTGSNGTLYIPTFTDD